ncbi:Hypothetical predicted protein, partial [Pelobates cultripes]
MAGDLNLPLEPRLDTSRGTSAVPAHCIHTTLWALSRLGLVDCRRASHPDDRDYTHYSAVHSHYNRIDYIFLAQEFLTLLHNTDIELMEHSDHAPVVARTRSPLFKPRERQWKLNESLLDDLELKTT